jgi:hypothetical protein
MLLSRSRKFLFVHIQKTGGRSLANFLKREIPDAQDFLGTHDHASWARQKLEPEWSQYFKFAFVRNPWDRLVSWYTAITQNTTLLPRYQRILRRDKYSRFRQYVLENSTSFEEFIANCTEVVDDYDGRKSLSYNQLDYVTGGDGKIIVDFIGRFENLNHDAGFILRELGIRDEQLPHIGRSRHRHYSEYYCDKTRNAVAQKYQRDIEFFGYEFEAFLPTAPDGGSQLKAR